jgi:hypothetical protein
VLLPILLAQAIAAGGATYSILDIAMDVPDVGSIRAVTLTALAALAMLTAIELWWKGPWSTGSRNAEMATAEMTRGRHAARFWGGGMAAGIVAPALLLAVAIGTESGAAMPAIAGLLIVIGLFWFEDAFVRAGQSVPLS